MVAPDGWSFRSPAPPSGGLRKGAADDGLNYFEITAEAPAPRPAFSGARRCDVCVVGAGFLGLSAALHLAERGLDVVVLEASCIGAGASGRNSGFVLPGYAADVDELVELAGRDLALRSWRLSVEAVDLVKSLVERHAIACDLKSGALAAAASPSDAAALARQAATMREFGYDRTRILSRAEIGDLIASPNYYGGLLDSGALHLHPLAYARGLARAALAQGIALYERSPVTRIVCGGRPQAITAEGTVTADHIVLAANALLGSLARDLAERIVPVTALIGATQPLGSGTAKQLLPCDLAVFDTQPALDYYRLTPDHRLLFGAATRLVPPPGSRAASWLARRIARVFPQLGRLRMDFVWQGLVDLTLNRLPDIGRSERIWYAQGFNGHGVALSTLTGRVIAEAIAGRTEDFIVLSGLPYRPWPGGPRVARIALPLVRSWFQFRHELDRRLTRADR